MTVCTCSEFASSGSSPTLAIIQNGNGESLTVSGIATNQNTVYVVSNVNTASGIWSDCIGTGTAIAGSNRSATGGIGIQGNDVSTNNPSSGIGILGTSNYNIGVKGTCSSGNGWAGYFSNLATTAGYGGSVSINVATQTETALAVNGISGFTNTIYAQGPAGGGNFLTGTGNLGVNGNATFTGTMSVAGYLSKGGGGYLIDHPAAPTEKMLNHCFVESPEMLNLYRGRATFDANGEAVVSLPGYFDAANEAPEYHLTPIGASMPGVHIISEVANGSFKVAGGVAGKSVSWQVSARRADAWAKANHPGVEITKNPEQKGKFLHPELFGAKEDARMVR